MASCMSREDLIAASKNMDPAELIQRLNEDAANFIDQLPKAKQEGLWSVDDWDKQMENHPLFMTKPVDENGEMSPLVEALQSLKYDPDENTPEELATSYKEDGNENFRRKKYRWAVDSYTEGLKTNCTDQELVVQLYSNRAAAHYHIGNYEKALKDSSSATAIKPDYMKAIERGALCCFKLNKLSECIKWCEDGLNISSENKLLTELRHKAAQKKKVEDRDRRKALAMNSKQKKDFETVKKAIADRKIQLGNGCMKSQHVHNRVHLDDDNKLVWPVMLLYPEYGITDYIEEFHEDSIFIDHFKVMFENDPPAWDKDKKYKPEKLNVYFMDYVPELRLVHVKKTDTLKKVLSHERYKLYDGIPAFFVTVAGSRLDKEFLRKYQLSC